MLDKNRGVSAEHLLEVRDDLDLDLVTELQGRTRRLATPPMIIDNLLSYQNRLFM